MDKILNLNRGIAVQKIDALAKELFLSEGLSCEKNTNLSITKAGTYGDKNGYATGVEIGIEELEHAKDEKIHLSKDNIKISDDIFARIVLNTFHEKAHCVQKNVLFRQEYPDSDTARQLLQEIACNASDAYYDGEINYRLNASEIQAEKEGILGAHEYLCAEFPNIDAKEHERIILDIVNDKMMKSSYFVKQSTPFTSLQEVEAAFDDAYDESFIMNRRFMMEKKPKDPVKVFMNDHEDAMEMYCNASTAVEQDRCIAAIALKLHPEWLEQYPALQHMDLSYENVIAKPYREIKEREERALHADEERINKVVKGEDESVKVPVEKHYDEKDLKGLSRAEQLDTMFGHLMKDENRENEPEK